MNDIADTPVRPRAPRRAKLGPAVSNQSQNTEESILKRLRNEIPHYLGPLNDACSFCGALHWIAERPTSAKVNGPHAYTSCCRGGTVRPPVDYFGDNVVPDFVRDLLTGQDKDSTDFQRDIRSYNNALSFTSLGGKVDRSVMGPLGVNIFRVNGHLTHDISALRASDGADPGHCQIYVIGGADEEEAMLRRKVSGKNLNLDILRKFQDFMYAVNPFAKRFQQAGEVLANNPNIAVKLTTMRLENRDQRTYNLPTTDEVAMIVEGEGCITENSRDVVLYTKMKSFESISDLNTSYLALRYVVFFPRGQQGYDGNFRMPATDKKISQMAWFAWMLFPRRNTFSPVLHGRRLFQELCVDLYICVEHWRLEYIRHNQGTLRAAIYHGVVEAMGRHDLAPSRTVILPSSHTGSPRYMAEQYHDSMALVNEFGMPGYFITMTTNADWREIKENLEYGETAQDRPDLVTRVFHLKAAALIDDVTKRRRLGHCVSWTFAIEHQKRSLPHIHLVLIMAKRETPRTIEEINLQVSADMPDPKTHPKLHQFVTKFMIHGPCSASRSCWRVDRCKLDYPRQHQEFTTIPEAGYPLYRRPTTGKAGLCKGRTVSTRDVVPYSPYLLLRYECHINVEIPASVRAIKYLYKYISKGQARSTATFTSKDEVLRMLDGRYISAPEACGRLFGHPIVGNFPAVTRLALHLQGAQEVYFDDDHELQQNMESGRAARTTLTEFFEMAKWNHVKTEGNIAVRSLYYLEMPKHFTWQKSHVWDDRARDTGAIGRVYFASLAHGERFYLRLLLSNIKGPHGFAEIRTVNGVVCGTYREAAHLLGLLVNDEHYSASLAEAARWQTGSQLRSFFALMLKHSPPADPMSLWIAHKSDMSDDCRHSIIKEHPDLQVDQDMVENLGLYHLSLCLQEMDASLEDSGLPVPDMEALRVLGPKFVLAINTDTIEFSQQYVEDGENNLNAEQRAVFQAVKGHLEDREGGMMYLDGPGGTGKTFTLNLCLHYARVARHDAMAVASSGTAAILLLEGQTAHSAFKVPLKTETTSTCNFAHGGRLARRLKVIDFIVWDEIAMQNKSVIHCVDRSLRDLRGSTQPFGGILVLFSGDFRQTLPIIRHSTWSNRQMRR